MASRKSKGLVQYLRETGELIERLKNGEITEAECYSGMWTALATAAPTMTRKELQQIGLRNFAVHETA
jgi:hypothetical protein